MENNPEISPALTPKEWRVLTAQGIRREGSRLYISCICGDHDSEERFDSADCQTIAALALYEQPFGFTAKDAELLRTIHMNRPEWRNQLKSLAARIEALLPRTDDPRISDPYEE